MYWTEHHVLCCTASHCASKGANDTVMALRREVMRRGLDARILVNTCGTIDLCDIGPNILVYPEGTIYSGVKAKDVKDLVDAIAEGRTVERLVLGPETEAEKARHDFYAAVVAEGVFLPADRFAELVAVNGFDDDWVGEQQRRGFLARKPGADGGPETVNPTRKARDRYGV